VAPSPIVIDTSALLDHLLEEENAKRVESVLADPLVQLHSPEILDQEILSVARRLERAGELPERRAAQLLRDAADFHIELHPLRPHFERVWSLRHAMWVADAYYVSLAESLEAPLLTTDEKLARSVKAARGVRVDVIVP
jgi:predicted nucleic acid-binding protein